MSTTFRRRFLRQTFAFSALTSAGWGTHSQAAPNPDAQHFLAVGDWGSEGSMNRQRAVAQAMQVYATGQHLSPAALLLLGDNFYGLFEGGVDCPRWRTQFEDMYPRTAFDCPCYA